MITVYRAEYGNLVQKVAQERKEEEMRIARELLKNGADYFVVVQNCPNLSEEEIIELVKETVNN